MRRGATIQNGPADAKENAGCALSNEALFEKHAAAVVSTGAGGLMMGILETTNITRRQLMPLLPSLAFLSC